LICQAQWKFLTFNQATHTLSFLYLFTRIAPLHPPPSLFFLLSHHQKSASLSFTELLLLSKTPSHLSVLPFYSTLTFPIKFFPPFPPFGASMQLHSSSSFVPPSLLHTYSHKCPMHSHAPVMEKNIRRQNQDDLIIPKHTLNARVFTLGGNPLLCYTFFLKIGKNKCAPSFYVG
jgi:hypothetical protein